MGTRNLTMVVSGGRPVIAQYGQWDGNPSGQGLTAFEFCRKRLTTKDGRARFKDALENTRFIDDDDEAPACDDAASLSRDTGAGILNIVWKSKRTVLLHDESDFAADSLFCEWAYVIDLDTKTFEVYTGFNTTPLARGERFAGLASRTVPSGKTYHPIRCIGRYNLDDLPKKRVFLKLEENDDEDDDDG